MRVCTGVWHKEAVVDRKKQGAGGSLLITFNEFSKNGPKDINVQTALTRVGSWENNCSVEAFVRSYVSQGNKTNTPPVSCLWISQAKEVTVEVRVNEGYATAAAMVFVWENI